MRLTAIELDGFRAFAKPQRIDLDADTVILVGANGHGKTSLFDGILWSLSGRVPRLGDDEKNIVSVYSSSGEAHVALEARSADGTRLRIARSFDGYQQRLRLEIGSEILREEEARFHLLRRFWPDALVTSDSAAAFTAAITRSVYLQQDLVRQFVEADSEQQRFAAVSELVGAGRVNELQLQLDRAKSAWSRVTNARAKEAESPRLRLRRLEAELETLSRPAQEVAWEIDTAWPLWWTKATELGVTVLYPADAASSGSPQALDAGVKQLLALRQSAERRRDQARRLLSESVSRSMVDLPNIGALRRGVEETLSSLDTARQELTRAQAITAERRLAQVSQQETREELRALAQLALRHLRVRCPVCTQPYNETATRAHLQQLVGPTPVEGAIVDDDVRAAATLVEQREKGKSAAERDLRRADQIAEEQQLWLGDRARRLGELGLAEVSDAIGALRNLEADLGALADTLKVHQERGSI